MVQRVFVLGVYSLGSQSVAPVLGPVNSHIESHRHVSVPFGRQDESSSGFVSRAFACRACVVRAAGTHPVDADSRSVCDISRVPRGSRNRLYERLWKPSS